MKTYFPADLVANADIACIKNTVQAFCRVNTKVDLAQEEHVIVVLQAEEGPTPFTIQRIKLH